MSEIRLSYKLTRDHIPDKIASMGKTAVWEVLSAKQFQQALDLQMIRKLTAYQENRDLKELADLLEILYALANLQGCSSQELDRMREKQAAERGSYSKGVFLKEILSD